MRLVEDPQMECGQIAISDIKFDPKSRDDIPQVLRGLQHIYTNLELKKTIFDFLENHISPDKKKDTGRPGMSLWKILVMGVLRLDLNWNYDRLHEQVNHHDTIRQMLGHSDFFDKYQYNLQTLKDNVQLLTPELLELINQEIVKSGHILLKKKESELLRGRCDSFVVETSVHYPTDINLLYDAMRKLINIISSLCEKRGMSDWRQHAYNMKHLKRLMRSAQNKKRGKGKTEEEKSKAIIEAHRAYIDASESYLIKAILTLESLENQGKLSFSERQQEREFQKYLSHANRQINQIERRVLNGETIAHEEKVFSIFEPHTEWISKGKAGVPVELGKRVCILEDQFQFILHHQVMDRKTDDQVAVSMVAETQAMFADLRVCSFDKGFHSPGNQKALSEKLDLSVLPRKGKLSKAAQEHESSEEFKEAKQKHSAVESAINALEVHGLDGFKRYVALAIVARNIQRIGAILLAKEQKRIARRKEKENKRAA